MPVCVFIALNNSEALIVNIYYKMFNLKFWFNTFVKYYILVCCLLVENLCVPDRCFSELKYKNKPVHMYAISDTILWYLWSGLFMSYNFVIYL